MIVVAAFLFIVVIFIGATAFGYFNTSNPRQVFTFAHRHRDGDTETLELIGRTRVPLKFKINPVWWFLNDEDPVPPEWYRPGTNKIVRTYLWYLRNPLHNFGSYVVGVEDRNYKAWGHAPLEWVFWSDIGVTDRRLKVTVVMLKRLWLPGFTYDSPSLQIACGWRLHGRFAIKVRFKRK